MRPLFQYSFQQLEALFTQGGYSAEILTSLRSELIHRSTNRAKQLLEAVNKRLEEIAGAKSSTIETPPSTLKSEPVSDDPEAQDVSVTLPCNSVDTNASTFRIPDDLAIPKFFTKIRSPGTSGLPDPYERKRSQELKLGLPKDADIVDAYIAALSALIAEIKRTGSGQKRYELENGVRVEAPHGEVLYSFPFTDEAELFEDAEVCIEIPEQRADGSIVSIDAGKLLLAISCDLGAHIKRAVLVIDATALLNALKDKLESAKTGQITINRVLSDAAVGRIPPPQAPETIPPAPADLKGSQREAYRQALTDSVTWIWGPPGCGKTTTLAALVRAVFEGNKRVLISSNTNKAVDQVLWRLCETLKITHPALEQGFVVRVGRIADEQLEKKYENYVTVGGIVARRSEELERRKNEIQEELGRIDARTANARRILDLFAKYEAAQSTVSNLQKKLQAASQRTKDLEAEHLRLDQRVTALVAEMEKRQKSRLGLFQRSLEEIDRSMTETKAARDKQARLFDEARTSAESIAQNMRFAQRDLDLLSSTVSDLDRDKVEREIAAANTLRDPLVQELREIDSKLAELRASIMKDARVIGATCTKTYLSAKDLGQFDMVIIDEASMVLAPMIWFAAGRSRERVVICGDPRQIPPIVPTDQQAVFDVLGHDVFEKRVDDPSTAKLDTQYRMAPDICDLISKPMYKHIDGGLKTAVIDVHGPGNLPPDLFNSTLTIIDTSELWPFESVNAFRSRFNLMHALLARNLAWHLNQSGYVDGDEKRLGICTPYAAQAKLIQKLLDGEGLNKRISAGTVHRYQGDQSRMMVLEIPESHGGAWSVGQFVQGVAPGQVGARLLNVAVSRAQSYLVVIANLTYLDKHLPSSSLLRSILFAMQEKGRIIPGRDLLALRPIESDLRGLLGHIPLDVDAESFGLFDEKSFDGAIKADFLAAKDSIVVFSGFVTPRRVAEFGDLFRVKIAEGVKIRCVTRPPHLNGSMSPTDGKQALDALEGIGCVVDCRARIHQKVILIDNKIVWHGSLNALSHAHVTEESMTRVVNEGLAQALAAAMAKKRYSREKASSMVAQAENPRCEQCGARSVYAEGRHGAYFYCENRTGGKGCDWSINLIRVERGPQRGARPHDGEPPEPRAGPPCPKCGGQTVLRSSAWGTFYGCKKHPACDGVVKSDRGKKEKQRSRRAESWN